MPIPRFYGCDQKESVSVRVSIVVIQHPDWKQTGKERVYSSLQFSGPFSGDNKPGTWSGS